MRSRLDRAVPSTCRAYQSNDCKWLAWRAIDDANQLSRLAAAAAIDRSTRISAPTWQQAYRRAHCSSAWHAACSQSDEARHKRSMETTMNQRVLPVHEAAVMKRSSHGYRRCLAAIEPVGAAADKTEIDKVRFPDLADLMARLHFSTSDGRIWLDDQRMLLIHAKALGSLRREMIEALGVDVARGFFTRMGYHAGAQDAQMARKVRSKTTLQGHVRRRSADALPGRHRLVRAGAPGVRRRAGHALRRVHLDQPGRGRRAHAAFRRSAPSRRAGCRSAMPRASPPSSWAARCCTARSSASRWASRVPHRRQAGRGMGRARPRRTCST